jgi:hypothetical protein
MEMTEEEKRDLEEKVKLFEEHCPPYPVTSHSGRYILDNNGEPVLCPSLARWALWFEWAWENNATVVARTEVESGHCVSTVFLGVDHNFSRYFDTAKSKTDYQPMLFETMAFNDYGALDYEGCFARYSSRAEALAGHEKIVIELRMLLAYLNQ